MRRRWRGSAGGSARRPRGVGVRLAAWPPPASLPPRQRPFASAADGAIPTKARSVRARIRAAIAPDRRDAGRLGDGREERGEPPLQLGRAAPAVATPSMTATVRPSAKTARIGPWIGSSWSSRIASSSDGTPRPPSRPASRGPLPGHAVADLAELPEDVGAVGVERDRRGRAPRSRGTSAGIRGPVRASRNATNAAGSLGSPRPSASDRRTCRLAPLGDLTRVRRRVGGSARSSTRTGRGRAPATAVGPSRSSRPGRASSTWPPVGREVVQQEVVRLGEPGPPVEQREDLALVALDEPRVRLLVEHRPPELHAVLLAEALDLPVAEHRQPGQRRQHRRHAEVLVALAELLDRGLLVGVAHEVDVALEDLRVELDGLLDRPSGSPPRPRRGACA